MSFRSSRLLVNHSTYLGVISIPIEPSESPTYLTLLAFCARSLADGAHRISPVDHTDLPYYNTPSLAPTHGDSQLCSVRVIPTLPPSPAPLTQPATCAGSFVGLYKLILNALPLVLPSPRPPVIPRSISRSRSKFRSDHRHRLHLSEDNDAALVLEEDEDADVEPRGRFLSDRRGRLSISAQAHQMWVRKKTRRWYSVAAGALAGGLAILWEKEGRRVGIAQQMFVR